MCPIVKQSAITIYHNICTNFLILQLHCDLPLPPNVQTKFFLLFQDGHQQNKQITKPKL